MDVDRSDESDPLLNGPSAGHPKTKGALIASRRWITVEPVVTAFAIALGTLMTVQTQYFHYHFSKFYNATGAQNETHCNSGEHDSSNASSIDDLIQSETSKWVTYCTVCMSFGALPTAFIIGCYSDHVGRKVAITCPLVGLLLSSMCNFIAIKYELPLYTFLISVTVAGLCGGLTLAVAACTAYISDFTTEKNRMIHFVLIEVLLFVMIAIPQVGMGFVIEHLGYAAPYLICVVILAASLLYMWIPRVLPETVKLNLCGSPLRTAVRESIRLFKPTGDKRHLKLSLHLFLIFSVVGFGTGSLQVSVVYSMGEPFCFTTTQIGFYTCAMLLVSGMGCIIGGALLPLCVDVFGLLYLSFVSLQLYFVTTALAVNSTILFFATVPGALRLLAVPVCRTAMSKMVKPSEQGTLFSVIGIVTNVAEFLFPVFQQSLYRSTVSFNKQLVFYVSAGLVFIPLIVAMILQLISRKTEPQPVATTVMNVQSSEE